MFSKDQIELTCTDNDKKIKAIVISQSDTWMTVVITPGNIKLNLKKTKPNIYVGNMSGYEFVHKLNNK